MAQAGDKIVGDAMQCDDEQTTERPDVPLLAILGKGTMIYTWMLQLGVWLGRYLSGGKWPATPKYWAVAAAVLLSTLYQIALQRHHIRYRRVLANTPLTLKKTFVIVSFVMLWVFFFVWLMIGPPGPEFRLK
ncbi:MAG: hypothetical protein IT427_21090 [Pirellulales bacterium]|nr:hypothetical protein [Pirellulales bacterium]